jgi:hypothetical protein
MDREVLMTSGLIFELRIKRLLEDLDNNSRIITDLEIYYDKLARNKTQIDVVAIYEDSIFVIEAKNWSKYIKGNFSQYNWRGLSGNPKGMDIISPVMQNYLHIRLLKSKALQEGIQLPPIFNIVCVPDSCRIISDCNEVMNYSELIREIKYKRLGLNHSLYDLDLLYKFIDSCRL